MLLSIPLPPEVGRDGANSFLARAYELGFDAISIHCSPEAEYLDIDWLRRMKTSYGLEIALHTPTKNFDLSAPLEDVRRLSVSYAIRMVKTGESVGALYYEIHLGGHIDYSLQESFAVDNAVRSLRELLALKPSAKLTVENDDRGYIFANDMILAEVLDIYPEVMLTLDIAHTCRSGGKLALIFHLELDPSIPLDEAHRVSEEIEDNLMRAIPNLGFVSIHTESSLERSEATLKEVEDREMLTVIEEAKRNIEGIEEIHEATVIESKGTKVLTLHIELKPDIPLRKAHQIASNIEVYLKERLKVGEVYIHLEPRKPLNQELDIKNTGDMDP